MMNLFLICSYSGVPQMQMLAQQKQQQMQRDPSDGNNQQRPQSPGSAENVPSPSKRPRLDGAPFNPQQMPNGRGQGGGMPQQVGDTGPSNAIQAAHMQLTNGIEPNNLTAQQFPNIPGGPNNNNPTAQARLAGYQQNLAQQQNAQMATVKAMPNQGGPANQGSPMMTQGQDSGSIANYYNPGDMSANGMRSGPGGAPGTGGGNHALQDYQMQLMLLEQQNKKRLMMARQEQDSMMPRPDGSQGAPGAVGPNGQPYQGTSPQNRSVNSPNPGDQMKRGTPHMNNAGMPSPVPEGQSRGSPSGMNFNMAGNMDPSMNPQYFKIGNNGMDPNMARAMPNGMQPPSSHPGGFQNGMTTQQMAMTRQQQMQQGAAVQQNWTNGPNGQMMPQGAQGAPQQNMGTPQQRAMPPPSAPATGAATNGRTQPPSPQQNAAPPTPSQANKANPKKKAESKDSKAKVYSIALNGFFCRNVDIDDSGLQRRDPLQTSPLVLHHPPKPTPPLPQLLPRRLPPSIRKALMAKMALVNQSPMVSPLLLLQMWFHSSPILYRQAHSTWVTIL